MERVIYINAEYNNEVETVDEFPYNNRQERVYAQEMIAEYAISDRSTYFYLSQRCTNDWRNK